MDPLNNSEPLIVINQEEEISSKVPFETFDYDDEHKEKTDENIGVKLYNIFL